MKPARITLEIWQGATWRQDFVWKDSAGALLNLTGYTARMQIRPALASSIKLADLTTENGGIALGGAAGTIVLTLTAAQTAAITAESGVFDLELVSPTGDVTRLMEGPVIISFEVTR